MNQKNPLIAGVLSLVPGLGQLYIGKTKKGLSLLCIDAGILVTLVLFPALLTRILMGGVYFFTMAPAAIECYLVAKTGQGLPVLDSKKYVVFMLLTTGFTALPLLWQNARFTRRGKILWTIAVALLAFLFFWILAKGSFL